MFKSNKAITLIALVITIIVLIILAAVTLGVLAGDNGIITRAIQSKESTGTKQEAEFVNLITSKIRIEEKIGETVTQEDLQGYIDEVFGTDKATGSISEGNYIIEVTGGKTYTITTIGVENSDEPYVDPKYYYGTEIQTTYSGLYTNASGTDTLVSKTNSRDTYHSGTFAYPRSLMDLLSSNSCLNKIDEASHGSYKNSSNYTISKVVSGKNEQVLSTDTRNSWIYVSIDGGDGMSSATIGRNKIKV